MAPGVYKRPKGTRVKALSIRKIRESAELVREALGVANDPQFNVAHALEFKLQKWGFEYEIVPKEEMGDNHGLTYPDKGLIQLREDVYEGALAGNGRDRFTVGHEKGHLFLHTGIPLARQAVVNPSHHIYEDAEWQADTFASELLMPLHMIKQLPARMLVPGEIADYFQVSYQAAEVRLNKLRKRKEI